MRQNLAAWHGSHEQRVRLFRRTRAEHRGGHPPRDARCGRRKHFIAIGGDARFAADQIVGDDAALAARDIPRDRFLSFCEQTVALDDESLVEAYRLPLTEVETLVPALLVYRELLLETQAEKVLVPEATLRAGLLLDMVRTDEGRGIEDFSRQVLASAAALGEKYRYDARHARHVAFIAVAALRRSALRARPRGP